MRNLLKTLSVLMVFVTTLGYAQGPGKPKVKLSGKVVEQSTKAPLEYATISAQIPGRPNSLVGGITDPAGNFEFEVPVGTYDIIIEFISFNAKEIKGKQIQSTTNLGTIELSEDGMMLDEVVVRAERTTVDIKLDKKVYNVGDDLMVKGGTVSDVLDNIPSVAVDSEGTVSLRGNENVRILIDGKPSTAVNVTEALRLIPADAIEKVEVVTNPSARYDSEGGGGLLNIILKKGKNQGINGTVIATMGDPEHYGISANLNYKTKNINAFTTIGYNYRNMPGNSMNDSRYLNDDGSTNYYIDERRNNERLRKGYNANFGFDWYITPTATWNHTVGLRKNDGGNDELVRFYNYDANRNFLFENFRLNEEETKRTDVQYSTNFTKNFKKEGHKLTMDAQFSLSDDHDWSSINYDAELTNNDARQSKTVLMTDYVLPLGEHARFEAGYKGEFTENLTDYAVDILDPATGEYVSNMNFTNELEYKEKVNALYAQYGTKIGQFSALVGLRWEDSNIDINQLMTSDFNNKRYNNFFPSAFLTYEMNEEASVSVSYSRRISRPRGRMLNPFSNYSSNINLFRGNPDLDPAFTDAYDLGYLHRLSNKLTLSTSAYFNRTTESFQFVRRESGEFVTTEVNGQLVQTPVILTTPSNLGLQYRAGLEVTLNYSPFRWWRINSNVNFFRNETQGEFFFETTDGDTFYQNFDNVAFAWTGRINSKLTLPGKIDWQLNFNYRGEEKTAQGKMLAVASLNTGLSKDVLKDKATIALNVQDVFNSRKMISDTYIQGLVSSHSEMQWRERQITLSLTYRFNKPKNEREQRRPDMSGDDSEGQFPG